MKRRDFVRSGGAIATAFHNFPYHLYAGEAVEVSCMIDDYWNTDLVTKIPAASVRG